MEIKLNRPLVFFDIESTGLDIVKDRIIDLSIIILFPDMSTEIFTYRFNPQIPIPAETTAIHGITNEDVKDSPIFSEKAVEIFEHFYGRDVAGYNSNYFDVPILVEHFLRTIRKTPFEDDTLFIDVNTIFKKKEERTLSAAVKFFLGEEHTEAHSSGADTLATLKVLLAQIKRYPDIGDTAESLSKFSQHGKKNVDYAGKLVFNENNEPCYNIGKSKGVRVIDDPGFGEWMLSKDFPLETKMQIESLLYSEPRF
jgi:DNA polymerase-3 subunit epsilon